MTTPWITVAAAMLGLLAFASRAVAQEPATQPSSESRPDNEMSSDQPDRSDRPDRAPGDRPERGTRGGMRGMRNAPTSQPDQNGPEKPSITEHDITIDGEPLHYRATAGQIPLKDDQGKTRANVFYVSYEKIDAKKEADRARPVAFIFNGGPGSAAIWLHLGTGGPRRVELPEDGMPPVPPHKVVDNPFTWLSFSDLVFIDPVGTGFSRVVEDQDQRGGNAQAGAFAGRRGGQAGGSPENFYSARGDVASVADFIRLWTTNNSRWTSPKFVAGESYGTTRAAGLSDYLIERYGIDLNGIVLISTVLNFQALDYSSGNDLPYPLYIPTYTACAWYHKKLAPDLQADLHKAVSQAQAWALSDYSAALARGSSLEPAQKQAILDSLAKFTGLPASYVNHSNMRISPSRFEKVLLADQEKVIGRFDGRVTGHDIDPLSDNPDFDPSDEGYLTAYSGSFNDYLRRELKYTTDVDYEVLSSLVRGWDFGGGGQGYYNIAPALASAMTKSPSLKVLVCCGYYDLATPFTGAEYQINALPLSKDLRNNISFAYYESGHMVYLPHPGLEKLHNDLADFFKSATTAQGGSPAPGQ